MQQKRQGFNVLRDQEFKNEIIIIIINWSLGDGEQWLPSAELADLFLVRVVILAKQITDDGRVTKYVT